MMTTSLRPDSGASEVESAAETRLHSSVVSAPAWLPGHPVTEGQHSPKQAEDLHCSRAIELLAYPSAQDNEDAESMALTKSRGLAARPVKRLSDLALERVGPVQDRCAVPGFVLRYDPVRKFGFVRSWQSAPESRSRDKARQTNSAGYPLRPGRDNCTYYLFLRYCPFGYACPLSHPEFEDAIPAGVINVGKNFDKYDKENFFFHLSDCVVEATGSDEAMENMVEFTPWVGMRVEFGTVHDTVRKSLKAFKLTLPRGEPFRQKCMGVIDQFDKQKNFGFIVPKEDIGRPEKKKRVFVHGSDCFLESVLSRPISGQHVEYSIVADPKRSDDVRAVHVTLAGFRPFHDELSFESHDGFAAKPRVHAGAQHMLHSFEGIDAWVSSAQSLLKEKGGRCIPARSNPILPHAHACTSAPKTCYWNRCAAALLLAIASLLGGSNCDVAGVSLLRWARAALFPWG